jgi:hypothetical protein
MFSGKTLAERAASLFHVCTLSGVAALLAEKQIEAALMLTLVAVACLLLLHGGIGVSEILRIKIEQYLRKLKDGSLVKKRIRTRTEPFRNGANSFGGGRLNQSSQTDLARGTTKRESRPVGQPASLHARQLLDTIHLT